MFFYGFWFLNIKELGGFSADDVFHTSITVGQTSLFGNAVLLRKRYFGALVHFGKGWHIKFLGLWLRSCSRLMSIVINPCWFGWSKRVLALVLLETSVFAFTADFITAFFGWEGTVGPRESVPVCVSAGLNDCTLSDDGLIFCCENSWNLLSRSGSGVWELLIVYGEPDKAPSRTVHLDCRLFLGDKLSHETPDVRLSFPYREENERIPV